MLNLFRMQYQTSRLTLLAFFDIISVVSKTSEIPLFQVLLEREYRYWNGINGSRPPNHYTSLSKTSRSRSVCNSRAVEWLIPPHSSPLLGSLTWPRVFLDKLLSEIIVAEGLSYHRARVVPGVVQVSLDTNTRGNGSVLSPPLRNIQKNPGFSIILWNLKIFWIYRIIEEESGPAVVVCIPGRLLAWTELVCNTVRLDLNSALDGGTITLEFLVNQVIIRKCMPTARPEVFHGFGVAHRMTFSCV